MNTKETIDAILAETGKAVLGKDDVLRRILTAILAGGHILIDDIPGVGKTTMAVAFTRSGLTTSVCSSPLMSCPRISRDFPCMTKPPAAFATWPAVR